MEVSDISLVTLGELLIAWTTSKRFRMATRLDGNNHRDVGCGPVPL